MSNIVSIKLVTPELITLHVEPLIIQAIELESITIDMVKDVTQSPGRHKVSFLPNSLKLIYNFRKHMCYSFTAEVNSGGS